jgi:GntR family transcriptional regulator, rspAB operon transcriptional repressor
MLRLSPAVCRTNCSCLDLNSVGDCDAVTAIAVPAAGCRRTLPLFRAIIWRSFKTLKHQCIKSAVVITTGHLVSGVPSNVRPKTIHLDRSRQVAVQVYEILKDRILAVDLAPGSVLARGALQEEFGVSQTPVRDALLRLQEDGLVDIYPQHATLVSRIDIDHARQAQFLRLSLELEAVRRLGKEDGSSAAADLAAILDQQERVAAPATFDRFDALDRDFHRVLYARSGNLHLWDVMRGQSAHLDRLRRLNLPMPGKMQAVLDGHRQIVEGLQTNNAGRRAEDALRRHLSGTLSIVDEIIAQHPAYVLGDESAAAASAR